MLYYATFVTGLQEVVARLAEAHACRIVRMLDGALLLEAQKPVFLPCFHNVYAVLSWVRCDARGNAAQALTRFMRKTADKPPDSDYRFSGRFNEQRNGVRPAITTTFRLVVSVENQLTAVDSAIKNRLEQLIAVRSGLTPDRGGAGHEFWFLYRSEGYAFFLKRLTHADTKTPRRGELRPELAYLLHALSEPAPGDTVLDPFCGNGAIPAARLRYFPCNTLYASDADNAMMAHTQEILRAQKQHGGAPHPTPHIVCQTADIDALPRLFARGSVQKIVTDPPWGQYDTQTDIRGLYVHMLRIFLYLTAQGGTIIILTSQKALLRELLSCEEACEPGPCPAPEAGRLVLKEAYDILVSGKKAGVFVIEHV